MLSIPFLYFLMDKEANPRCPWPGLWLWLCPRLRLRAVVVASNIEAESPPKKQKSSTSTTIATGGGDSGDVSSNQGPDRGRMYKEWQTQHVPLSRFPPVEESWDNVQAIKQIHKRSCVFEIQSKS